MTETAKRRRELLANLQQSAERIYLRPASKPDDAQHTTRNTRQECRILGGKSEQHSK